MLNVKKDGVGEDELLGKFRLLRKWQLQQHEKLIKKQQQQIETLQEQQHQLDQYLAYHQNEILSDLVESQIDSLPSMRNRDLPVIVQDVENPERIKNSNLPSQSKSNHSDTASDLLQTQQSTVLEGALTNARDELSRKGSLEHPIYSHRYLSMPASGSVSDSVTDDEELEEESDWESDVENWNTSWGLQTVVYKGDRGLIDRETCKQKPKNVKKQDTVTESIETSDSVSEFEMEGISPIIYSEDDAEAKMPGLNDGKIVSHSSGAINHQKPSNPDKKSEDDMLDVAFDERPIRAGIGSGGKTFEDLIEEHLKTEENGTKDQSNNLKEKKKSGRQFLRKGEGLARFSGKQTISKPKIKKKSSGYPTTGIVPNRLKLAPHKISRDNGGTSKVSNEPAQLTRSAITIDKVSRGSFEKDSERNGKVGNSLRKSHDGDVVHKEPNRTSLQELEEKPKTLKSGNILFQSQDAGPPQDASMEVSFQHLLHNLQSKEVAEDDELEEFELLEEAVTGDTSVSSSSSAFVHVVAKARAKMTSSPKKQISKVNGSPMTISHVDQPQFVVETDRSPSSDIINLSKTDDDVNENEFYDEEDNTIISVSDAHADHTSEKTSEDEGSTSSVEFNDQSTWGDITRHSEITDEDTTIVASYPGSPRKKPSAAHHNIVSVEKHDSFSSPPPTSALVAKMFPQLKIQGSGHQNDTTKSSDHLEPSSVPQSTKTVTPEPMNSKRSPDGHSDVIKTKLLELESEISRFKNENSTLETLRIEREQELKKLRHEVEKFQTQKVDELERIEKFKQEELQKLRHERRIFDKYQKAARAIPNKQEREEIEKLRQEVSSLQEELKRRESRWNASSTRFRKRIDELENENQELKEELKMLEKERLERWAQSEKEKGRKIDQQKSVLHSDSSTTKEELDVSVPQQLTNSAFSKEEVSKSAKRSFSARVSQQQRVHSPQNIIPQNSSVRRSLPRSPREEQEPRNDILPQKQPTFPSSTGKVLSPREEISPKPVSLTSENIDVIQNNRNEIRHPDGKIELIKSDGAREFTFPNGTRKNVSADGQTIIVSFFNGDIKQTHSDQRLVYYYAESKTTHTTYPDGLEVLEFPNNQVEKHYPNSTKEIIFPDQTVKCIFPNGVEETVFPDGTVQKVELNGDKTISFPNGQLEVHTQHFKKRIYPDGTVKTVYQDGKQETRYASGRVRVKDKEGNVVKDTGLF